MDEAARGKAEAPLLRYYELHAEPAADAQGPADFH